MWLSTTSPHHYENGGNNDRARRLLRQNRTNQCPAASHFHPPTKGCLVITERELVVLKRRARGETQREIAQALQITQGAVSRFEQRAHEKILDAEQVQRTAKEVGLRTEQGVSKRRVTYKERPRS